MAVRVEEVVTDGLRGWGLEEVEEGLAELCVTGADGNLLADSVEVEFIGIEAKEYHHSWEESL